MIELEKISKTFGYSKRYAVRDISLKISDGASYAVVGADGSGKSVLLAVSAGYMPPSKGRVLIDGIDLYAKPQECIRKIGFMPSKIFMYPEMTVEEYLRYMFKIKGAKKKRGMSSEICSLTGLEPTSLIRSLTGADAVKLRLAQAIAGDVSILMLDEPTFGLSREDARELRGIIKELKDRYTIILTTVKLREASELCDNILVLNHGRTAINTTLADFSSGAARVAVLRLRVSCDDDGADELISSLSPFADIERLPSAETDSQDMVLTFDAEKDIRPLIWQETVKRNIPILELVRKDVTVEEMLTQMTREGGI